MGTAAAGVATTTVRVRGRVPYVCSAGRKRDFTGRGDMFLASTFEAAAFSLTASPFGGSLWGVLMLYVIKFHGVGVSNGAG